MILRSIFCVATLYCAQLIDVFGENSQMVAKCDIEIAYGVTTISRLLQNYRSLSQK